MSSISTYQDWINVNYPTKESATNMCETASKELELTFPELTRVRGFVDVSGLGVNLQHWWCQSLCGVILDPTSHQWDGIILSYKEFEGEEPAAKCYVCGEFVYPSKSSNLIFCHKHDHLDINKLLSE